MKTTRMFDYFDHLLEDTLLYMYPHPKLILISRSKNEDEEVDVLMFIYRLVTFYHFTYTL